MDEVRADLHLHTLASPDSRLGAEEAVARALARGLRGIAVTDHNTMDGVEAVQVAAAGKLWVLPGVEVSTRVGHLLAFGVPRPPVRGRGWEETLEEVGRLGGVAIPSHPFRWAHGIGGARAGRAQVPALETVNGRNGRGPNRRAGELASARRLGATGGSDAHEPEGVGRAYTIFPAEVDGREAALAALRAGRTRAAGDGVGWKDRLALSLSNAGKRSRRGLRAP